MAKYFRFIGYLCIIGFIIAAFVDLIYLIIDSAVLVKSGEGWAVFVLVAVFVFFVVIGPAIGLLFLAVANIIENPNAVIESNNIQTSSTPNTNHIYDNEEEQDVFNNVAIRGGTIIIDDKLFRINRISDIVQVRNEVTIIIDGETKIIRCKNTDQAGKLYTRLRAKMK